MVSLSPEVLAKLTADGPVALTPEEAAGVMQAAQSSPPLNRKQRRALKKGKRRG
jgi:hypothetical protein